MHALVCPLCRIALAPVADVCPRDGQLGREVRWLAIPAALNPRFQLLEPFASGATGSLYLVDELATGRRGLLKILAPVPLEQLPERHRLRRELIKQATLSRGNVVTPLASGESDGGTWIFREWLDGVTLHVRLSREGALQQTEALAIAAQIATALDQLHRGGLLHRDVKPGHIFLQPTPHGIPRALLLDAGVTGTLPARGIGPLYGTAGYTAPEQLIGKLASFRSDLYSLGCVLYRMLTGRPAFAGESLDDTLTAQRYGELPPMPSHLPDGIGALLRSLLSKDPQERPFSAQKLRRTLDPFLPDGALMEKQPTTTFETSPEPGPSATPQPSGTLRPSAPSVRPSLPAPPSGLATPAGASSAPPPSSHKEKKRAKKREEGTQRIDLEDLQELDDDDLTPVPKHPTSVPPPVPSAGTGKPRSQPPSRAPIPPSEKTQPIRLDQILSIAASRALSQPPPTPPEEERPRSVAPEPAAATSPLAPIPMTDHSSAELDALLASDDSGIETLVTAPSTPAASAVKATLLGIGGDPLEPSPALPLGTAPAFTAHDAPTERVSAEQTEQSDEGPGPEATIPLTGRAFALPASLRGDPRKWLIYASAALVGLSALGVGASALFGGSEQPVAKKGEDTRPPPALPAAPSATGALAAAPKPRVEPLPTTEPHSANATSSKARAPIAEAKVAADTAEAERAEAERRAAAEREAAREAAAREAAEREAAAREAAEREAAAREAAAAARQAAAAERQAAAAARQEERARQRAARAEARAARKLARAEAKRERDEAKRVERERAKSAKSSPAEKSADKAALFADARDEARAHYTAKRYKEAAAAYERAARYDPNNPGTFAGLGAARLHLGDNRAAVQAYQRAVKLSPDSAGFQYALGRAYVASGEKSKAKVAYKRALAIDPKNEAAKSALDQLGG